MAAEAGDEAGSGLADRAESPATDPLVRSGEPAGNATMLDGTLLSDDAGVPDDAYVTNDADMSGRALALPVCGPSAVGEAPGGPGIPMATASVSSWGATVGAMSDAAPEDEDDKGDDNKEAVTGAEEAAAPLATPAANVGAGGVGTAPGEEKVPAAKAPVGASPASEAEAVPEGINAAGPPTETEAGPESEETEDAGAMAETGSGVEAEVRSGADASGGAPPEPKADSLTGPDVSRQVPAAVADVGTGQPSPGCENTPEVTVAASVLGPV
jgi:hypothetical protein